MHDLNNILLSKRHFMSWSMGGIGSTALATMLKSDLTANTTHFYPRAKRAINICLVGGLSHIDSFDYKPGLEKFHGKSPPDKTKINVFFNKVGLIRKHDWTFRRRGQSGLWISDLFPHIAKIADELTVIKSMHSDTGNHTPALFMCNSGFMTNGFPSLGSWLSYGLGNESDSLPTFVVIPDNRGMPSGGADSWSSAFLPAEHQGITLSNKASSTIRDLFPDKNKTRINSESSSSQLLKYMAKKQIDELGGSDPILEARLKSYELAAKLQTAIPDVANIESEPVYIKRLYGLGQKPTNEFARSCILSRRLLEKGVRFVQLYSGGPLGGKPRTSWDGHELMIPNHEREAARIDKPVAALIKDLKMRGMLEDTLITFTTEFGRTPFTESAPNDLGGGRDHNNAAFCVWAAGAGLRPGMSYGSTDEIGYAVHDKPVSWHDFHATLLHLFGIDHTKLSFYHNGIQRRLTNVHGNVLNEIIA